MKERATLCGVGLVDVHQDLLNEVLVGGQPAAGTSVLRSEERRVGKECLL